MSKYLIHAYPKRMWYVEQYLIPSMLKQGIVENDIRVYNDINGEGNLVSCLKSFLSCEGEGGTWHLQDDVCICHDFKERTEQYDDGIVCGFCSDMYDDTNNIGKVHRDKSWFSFPCIRIPNEYARQSAEWVNRYIIGNPAYRLYWQNGVNDDWAFRTWLKEKHRDEEVTNLVDHIDWLIGGGSGKKRRDKICRAKYFDDVDLVEELKYLIANSNN